MTLTTCVLIADPTRAALSEAQLDAARQALAGAEEAGPVRWLAPAAAAEFDLPQPPAPDLFWPIWRALQQEGIDLNCLPRANRRKQLFVADMDSTMIGQECIDELADLAGCGAAVAAVTARAMNGELAFEPALRERVALFRGLSARLLDRVWAERIRFTPGAATLLATLKAHGAFTLLVSGGFTVFTERVANALGFDAHRANRLLLEGGQILGRVAEPILGRAAKAEALAEAAVRLGVGLEHALAIGDGANDLDMLTAAGMGVAFRAKPKVQEKAPLRINHGDLTALLYLQGYRADEFVHRPNPVPRLS